MGHAHLSCPEPTPTPAAACFISCSCVGSSLLFCLYFLQYCRRLSLNSRVSRVQRAEEVVHEVVIDGGGGRWGRRRKDLFDLVLFGRTHVRAWRSGGRWETGMTLRPAFPPAPHLVPDPVALPLSTTPHSERAAI